MPSYSVLSTSSGSSKNSPKTFTTAGSPPGVMLSHRLYGHDVPSNISVAAVGNSFHGVDTNVNDWTPSPFNTRSPVDQNSYKNDDADTIAGIAPALWTMDSIVTHCSMLFGTRYYPVANESEKMTGGATNIGAGGAGTGFLNHFAVYSEGYVVPSRRCRRTRRRGYQPVMGNNVGLFAKTGSGAYSIIRPLFDNDTYFTDVTAWKLGPTQPTWNINLFGQGHARGTSFLP